MPYKDKERQREYNRKWEIQHKEERKKYREQWKKEHKDYYKDYFQRETVNSVQSLRLIKQFDKRQLIREKQNTIDKKRKHENPMMYKDYWTEEEYYGEVSN